MLLSSACWWPTQCDCVHKQMRSNDRPQLDSLRWVRKAIASGSASLTWSKSSSRLVGRRSRGELMDNVYQVSNATVCTAYILDALSNFHDRPNSLPRAQYSRFHIHPFCLFLKMRFQSSFSVILLACIHDAVAAMGNFSLYAYGKDIVPGMKMYYGDGQLIPSQLVSKTYMFPGLAYVGIKAPSFVSQSANITRKFCRPTKKRKTDHCSVAYGGPKVRCRGERYHRVDIAAYHVHRGR